ncbi:hypothetical protein CBM2592_B100347 [Cupriavidus taiwanensis]|nr:hypothetical protein CBM2592_B100347 [Cupriavidus taiwanensis]SOY63044.1 hypothetical protein CBM2588_B130010 [Cupriavidus taiwanensis]SOY98134.1 hypothetical protein CBM2591_B80349 [Cupriavidus taiwanensis]SOZ85173.1 hypothetical protein CBM2618_B130025 [Cupriavidus taiwanensis]SOZ88628.1 hypothetical protein CBM2622_B140027 [Cupriavidus taiwanensis]
MFRYNIAHQWRDVVLCYRHQRREDSLEGRIGRRLGLISDVIATYAPSALIGQQTDVPTRDKQTM